ncbi:MAG: hypothetical protein HGB19_11050, partial [Chlorobiales bacterium]|nr:hypothetical protein [Chlorobiales bacterium]
MSKFSNFLDSTAVTPTEDVLSSARGYSTYLLKLILADLTDRIKYIRRHRRTASNKLILDFLGYLSQSSDPIAELHDLNLDILFDFFHFLEQARESISEDFSSGKPTKSYQSITEKIETIATTLSALLSDTEKEESYVRTIQKFLTDKRASFKQVIASKDKNGQPQPKQADFGGGKEDFGFSLSTMFGEESEASAVADLTPPFSEAQPIEEPQLGQSGVKFLKLLSKAIENIVSTQKKLEVISGVFKKIAGSAYPIAELDELCFVPDFSDFKSFVKSLDELTEDKIPGDIISGTSEHLVLLLEGLLSDKAYAEKLSAYAQVPVAPEFLKGSEEAFSELGINEPAPEEDEPLPNITEAAMEIFAQDIEKSFEATSDDQASKNQLLLGESHKTFVFNILTGVLKNLPDTAAGNAALQHLNGLLRSNNLQDIIKTSPIGCIKDFSEFISDAKEKGISIEALSSHAPDITSELAELLVQHFETIDKAEDQTAEPSLLQAVPPEPQETDILSELASGLDLDEHAGFAILALNTVKEKLSGNAGAIAVLDKVLEQPDVITALLGEDVPCLTSFGKLVEASKQRSASLDFLTENLSEITDTIADSLPSELAEIRKPIESPASFHDDDQLLTPEKETATLAPEEDTDFSLSSLFEEPESGEGSAEEAQEQKFQDTQLLENLSSELSLELGDEMDTLLEQKPVAESEQETLSEQDKFDSLIIPEHPNAPFEREPDELDKLSELLSMDDLAGNELDFSGESLIEYPSAEPNQPEPSLELPNKEHYLEEHLGASVEGKESEEIELPELPDILSLVDSFGEEAETTAPAQEKPGDEQHNDAELSTAMFLDESLLSLEETDLKEEAPLSEPLGSLTNSATEIAEVADEEAPIIFPLSDAPSLPEELTTPDEAETAKDENLLFLDDNFLLDDSFTLDDSNIDFGN